jgi:hypothetical protein
MLPREAHITIPHKPHCDNMPPRISLSIMRTNRQIHDEVAKYFYERRALFMRLVRNKDNKVLSDKYISCYHRVMATMNPQTLLLFTDLEIQIGYLADQRDTPRQWGEVYQITEPLRQMLTLLPNLTTVIVSFARYRPVYYAGYSRGLSRQTRETVEWLLDNIPRDMNVLWDWDAAVMPIGKSGESSLVRMIRERGRDPQNTRESGKAV